VNHTRNGRPRGPSAIEFNLDLWRKAVLAVEKTFRSSVPHYPDLPCCDAFSSGLAARDRLEAVIRHGGRQGHRVAVSIKELDDRFERATVKKVDADAWLPWWHGREHVDTLR
jgi:hypothetical protein